MHICFGKFMILVPDCKVWAYRTKILSYLYIPKCTFFDKSLDLAKWSQNKVPAEFFCNNPLITLAAPSFSLALVNTGLPSPEMVYLQLVHLFRSLQDSRFSVKS